MTRYVDWVRGMKCVVPVCSTPGEAHHVRARGAGGRDCDCVPLCRLHHAEIHQMGLNRFQQRYGAYLGFAAKVLHEAWLKPRPPPEEE